MLIKEGGYTSQALKGHLLQTVASDASRGSSAILQGRKQRQAALKWPAGADSRTRPIHCHPALFLA